jgi:hypothetical protein
MSSILNAKTIHARISSPSSPVKRSRNTELKESDAFFICFPNIIPLARSPPTLLGKKLLKKYPARYSKMRWYKGTWIFLARRKICHLRQLIAIMKNPIPNNAKTIGIEIPFMIRSDSRQSTI